MSVAPQLDPLEPSPLASARLHRKLTVEEAARRAGVTADQIEWLEAGRVYRFPTADDALLAAVLYAASLGIDADEARRLARLPVEPRPERSSRRKVVGAGAGIVLLAALAVALLGAFGGDAKRHPASTGAPLLPAPWKLTVDVLNGGGDI
jgi:transcriptional regulator with XRE-family HTH domain